MNIVIFTDTYLPKIDGVAISVDRFTRILSERGHKFIICSPGYGGDDTVTPPSGVEILRFKSAPLPSYPDIKVVLPSQSRIYRAMSEFKPDLVHIQTPGLLGQYGMIAAKMYGVPMIGTYHTLVSEQDTYLTFYRLLKVDKLMNYFRRRKKIKSSLERIERKQLKTVKKRVILNLTNRIYEAGHTIISPSHLIKKELESYGVKKPIQVISNGLYLNKFDRSVRTAPGNDSPKLLHVGRISYEKNCDVILKSFALILERFPGATLDIIGDGPALSSLKIKAEQLEISDRVHFPGFIPHEKLPSVYPDYHLFLTASTMETQGLVVLEAIASGLPCVGVDSYALPELIVHERNGYITKPFYHIEIARSAIQILENPDLYRKFSEESIKIASEHDVYRSADQMEELYIRVAASSLTSLPEEKTPS